MSPLLADTPEIMVHEAVGYHHVHDSNFVARTGGNACVDDEVWSECVDEADRTDGGIDLADATLHDSDFIFADESTMIGDGTAADGRRIREEGEYQGLLFLHGHNYAYFHFMDILKLRIY